MKNRKITIIMTTGNDAFQTDEDVLMAMRKLVVKLETHGIEDCGILDGNGRTVGTVKVEDDEPAYSHRYSVKVCPDCGHDLTQRGGVIIETTDGDNVTEHIRSRLDNTGTVVDVNDVIEDGLHSDTLCSKCNESLADYEES